MDRRDAEIFCSIIVDSFAIDICEHDKIVGDPIRIFKITAIDAIGDFLCDAYVDREKDRPAIVT